ncbi:T9SS type A sorting domain-containing protein, partial [Caldithrix abyssi]
LLYDISNWYPYVEDKDNPDSTLNFDLTGAKVVTVVKKDHAFLLKAPANWFGSDTLTLTVDDGLVGNSTSVLVNVKAVNDAPEIRNLPSEITFDNDTTYVLTMKDFAFDIDTPDSLLSWNFMVSNDSLKFSYDTESTNLTLSAPQFAGTVQLTCILSDDSSATTRDTIEVVVTSPTGLQDDLFSQIPKSFELRQNFPNPFNPLTKIRFGLPRAGKISITVYNILGKKVATVFEGDKPAGYHVVTFNGSHLASGIYFYRLTTEDGKAFIRKMVLLK